MPKSATPPLSVDCIACGTKMDLTAVEPRDHRTVYTYQCPSRHLQELAIPEQLSPPRTSPAGGFWKHLRSERPASKTHQRAVSESGRGIPRVSGGLPRGTHQRESWKDMC
jgi:hypothetical protein